MKSNTKKLSLALLAVITAFFLTVGLFAINGVKPVKADGEPTPTLGTSRFSVSKTGGSILLVTPLTGDTSAIYQLGYTFSGDQPTVLQGSYKHYYTTLIMKGVSKHANDLFGGDYTESTPMIIWEIENNAEETYTYSAYYKAGHIATAEDVAEDETLELGGLYPNWDGEDVPVYATAKTAKIYTVTYKDGDTEVATEKVGWGNAATAKSVPGFTYDWKLDSAAYDLSTAVTGDITLQGENKTVKTIDMWSGCTTDNAVEGLTVNQEKDYVASFGSNWKATRVNTLKYQTSVYASSGNANGVMNWGFDCNTNDINAWIDAGYDWITFFVYSNSYHPDASPRFECAGKSSTIRFNLTKGSTWNPVVLRLDEIVGTSQAWRFTIVCGAGNHASDAATFSAAVTHPTLVDSTDRPVPVILGTSSSLQRDNASTYKDWEYGKDITATHPDPNDPNATIAVTKTSIVYQEQTSTTSKARAARLYLFAGFTSDYISALKDAGYSKVTYYIYAGVIGTDFTGGGTSIEKVWNTAETAYRTNKDGTYNYLLLRNRWSKVEVSLDTLKTQIDNNANDAGLIYAYIDCKALTGTFSVAVTQPVLE